MRESPKPEAPGTFLPPGKARDPSGGTAHCRPWRAGQLIDFPCIRPLNRDAGPARKDPFRDPFPVPFPRRYRSPYRDT